MDIEEEAWDLYTIAEEELIREYFSIRKSLS